ncbi:Lrp/AsnC family transcriptional regulator [Hyphomicrobiales bacterium]|jgi:Lrp/AsnC family transcriptional regulator|nr:Lrp/AsnC family transcriptional regulator [Rhodobiaceae bacterium]MDB4128022.1 Lrp/AsnC family transcriptional regulator [Hyphomicrobiales bacterium]MBT5641245.1 Lrp/AsnC family transcriptional regulator [Rhodobiaceae bacterium]MBT6222651.1 Lrp/AsnC family transcriptional regulator [Rhodobiaceae bacterium]MDB4831688.1 Lrp/AsnC family transcriptional regulator [Hyphomicrobiales bacterium]|tara:strand:+ start:6457 stop:6966 length:510 start_codon:yes stop_codon:yes gene_type:complete
MTAKLDRIDRKILTILQSDCTMAVSDIALKVGLSTTPCWRRIQRLDKEGVIAKRVAILDPKKINASVTAFVAVKTNEHNNKWLSEFKRVIDNFPEVVEFYRMAGEIDYLLRIVVPDINSFDRFYKKLIEQINLTDVSTSFAMEQIKYTTSLPLNYTENVLLENNITHYS